MQGFSDGQRELLDAESVTGHLLSAGSVFAFLAEHRQVLFPAEMFTDLFQSGKGRPSVAPDVVASVLVLQALNGLSDRQAAEAVTFDLRWKAACGFAVTDTSFHPTTLTYWRRRPSRRTESPMSAIRSGGSLNCPHPMRHRAEEHRLAEIHKERRCQPSMINNGSSKRSMRPD